MKIILTYLFFLTGMSLSSQTKIKIHVTYTNSFCGGMRPTPEIEANKNKPKDLHNVHLVLKGKMHCKVITDSLGHFVAKLKPGKYQIYLTKLKNEAHFTNYDPSCEKMLNQSYGELIIEKDKDKYQVNLHFPCNPCEPPRP